MLNQDQIDTLLRVAFNDAIDLLADLSSQEGSVFPVTPENYDGDGEAFSFRWNEGAKHEFGEENHDQAETIYLAAFWFFMEDQQRLVPYQR